MYIINLSQLELLEEIQKYKKRIESNTITVAEWRTLALLVRKKNLNNVKK